MESEVETAVNQRNYPMMKALFDERLYLSIIINKMINLCLVDRSEYDASEATKCKNFLFFKRLLKQSGVNLAEVLPFVLWSHRIHYFWQVIIYFHLFDPLLACYGAV